MGNNVLEEVVEPSVDIMRGSFVCQDIQKDVHKGDIVLAVGANDFLADELKALDSRGALGDGVDLFGHVLGFRIHEPVGTVGLIGSRDKGGGADQGWLGRRGPIRRTQTGGGTAAKGGGPMAGKGA